MTLPVHRFVANVTPLHLGYPSRFSRLSTSTNSSAYYSPASPVSNVSRQALEYGINHSRVSIAYTGGDTTAILTWLDGATHDFVVDEYLNLRGYGGVNTAGVEGYYRVSAVASSTQLTIDVPSSFAPTSGSSGHVLENPYFGYDYINLNGSSVALPDQASGVRHAATWTNNTSVALTSVVAKFGTTCMNFSGANRYFSGGEDAFRNSCYDFTMEAWAYPTSSDANARYFGWWPTANAGVGIQNGYIIWCEGGTIRATGNTAIALNQFTHLAVCRKNGVVSLYVGGVKQAQTYTTSDYGAADAWQIHIGGTSYNGYSFPGYLQNFILKQGVAAYQNDFTPINALPRHDRPGVGYFVSRGGNMVTAYHNGSDVNYGRSTNSTGLGAFVFRLKAVLDAYGSALTNAFFLCDTTVPYTGGVPKSGVWLGILNSSVSIGNCPKGLFRHNVNTDAATYAALLDLSFIGSDCGFYIYARRDEYPVDKARRSSLVYVGKPTPVFTFDEPLSTGAEVSICNTCCLFSTAYDAGYYSSDDGMMASYVGGRNTGGLLNIFRDSGSNAPSSGSTGTLSGMNTINNGMCYTQLMSGLTQYACNLPLGLSRYLTMGSVVQGGSNAIGLYDNIDSLYDRAMIMSSLSFATIAPSAFIMRPPPYALGTVMYPPVSPYIDYVDFPHRANTPCVITEGVENRGIISLNPYDWETVL